MVAEKKSQVVTLRMAPAEFNMLQQLADADGLYQSDVIRLLVRRAHAERFTEQPKATKRPKR
jgi:hypothetical protein